MPKSKGFDLVFRIYPGHRDLDPGVVLKALGLDHPAQQIASVTRSTDAEMVEVRFRDEPVLGDKEVREWQIPEFRNAAGWLKQIQRSELDHLRTAGVKADLYVGGYWGPIPLGLLEEAARHRLPVWIGPPAGGP